MIKDREVSNIPAFLKPLYKIPASNYLLTHTTFGGGIVKPMHMSHYLFCENTESHYHWLVPVVINLKDENISCWGDHIIFKVGDKGSKFFRFAFTEPFVQITEGPLTSDIFKGDISAWYKSLRQVRDE